jgi:hypothetical protein
MGIANNGDFFGKKDFNFNGMIFLLKKLRLCFFSFLREDVSLIIDDVNDTMKEIINNEVNNSLFP